MGKHWLAEQDPRYLGVGNWERKQIRWQRLWPTGSMTTVMANEFNDDSLGNGFNDKSSGNGFNGNSYGDGYYFF